MTALRRLSAMALGALFLAAGCSREAPPAAKAAPLLKPPAPVSTVTPPSPESPSLPASFGPLRFDLTGAPPASCRVTCATNDPVNFTMPLPMLQSIVANDRVPEEIRVKAILAYPQIAARPPSPSESSPVDRSAWKDAVRLDSPQRGQVTVELDASDATLAKVSNAAGAWQMPASVAHTVLTDPRLTPAQQAEALLTYPGLKPVSPAQPE